MIWKFAKQIKTLIPFLILITLSANQMQAEINPKCAKSGLLEQGGLCISTSEIINEINNEFQTVYSIGNVTAISQPPLIITPKVTVQAPEAPLNLQTIRKSKKTAKMERNADEMCKPDQPSKADTCLWLRNAIETYTPLFKSRYQIPIYF